MEKIKQERMKNIILILGIIIFCCSCENKAPAPAVEEMSYEEMEAIINGDQKMIRLKTNARLNNLDSTVVNDIVAKYYDIQKEDPFKAWRFIENKYMVLF